MPEIAIEIQEKPILFSGAMVRKIIEDLKTKTRRVIKEVPHFMHYGRDIMDWSLSGVHQAEEDQPYGYPEKKGSFYLEVQTDVDDNSHREIFCPYGKPGDRLWVREAFNIGWLDGGKVLYRADGGSAKEAGYPSEPVYKPSIHMPRWASRLTLEIVSVKVERVQEISEEDAKAEGCPVIQVTHHPCSELEELIKHRHGVGTYPAKTHFHFLWDSINAKRGFGWEKNPWVWAIEFRRVEPTQ